MPDVGLFTASEPLPEDMKVVIKYSVEVGGLPVYNESYDVDTLREEYAKDPKQAEQLWIRRLKAPVECRFSPMFSSAVTTYVATGENPHQ